MILHSEHVSALRCGVTAVTLTGSAVVFEGFSSGFGVASRKKKKNKKKKRIHRNGYGGYDMSQWTYASEYEGVCYGRGSATATNTYPQQLQSQPPTSSSNATSGIHSAQLMWAQPSLVVGLSAPPELGQRQHCPLTFFAQGLQYQFPRFV